MSRMDLILDRLLSTHGKDLLDHYSVLLSISRIVQNILGMTATIARSSRSYSIGLRNGDLEVVTSACVAGYTHSAPKEATCLCSA